ncbi:MAG: nucleotidyltransferase domain-containing protein [Candidatus Aenigmarchaeota archaeon]|nr:nucleotidyltransferase domain-containing protein [Candidatus Aenigmarchaeota archaeon]
MKREAILALFFNEPTKHWSFTELMQKSGVSRPQVAQWLKRLAAERLIQKVKQQGKMPYYISSHASPAFQMKKRVFALEQLEKSGFLAHLAGLPKADAIYLFGSMSRWDWYSGSDVDIFIYGDDKGLELSKFESTLHREIEVFVARDKKDLSRFGTGLLHNIIKGYRIKGELHGAQT